VIESTTVLFGLPGVKVTSVFAQSDGSRVVEVVTDEDTAAACPACGVLSTSVKARLRTTPKDIPYGENRTARDGQRRCGSRGPAALAWSGS